MEISSSLRQLYYLYFIFPSFMLRGKKFREDEIYGLCSISLCCHRFMLITHLVHFYLSVIFFKNIFFIYFHAWRKRFFFFILSLILITYISVMVSL